MARNPFIYVGDLHNDILDYVITQSPNNPPEIAQMTDLISEYYAANYAPVNNIIEKNRCYSLLMNYYNELFGLTKIQLKGVANSRNGANPFNRKFIDDVFIDYSSFTIDSIITYINGLQDNIIVNSDVPIEMKQLPFFTTAIGLKSAEYWKYQYDNQTNWYPFIQASPKGGNLADFVMGVLLFIIFQEMENKQIEPKAGDIVLSVFAVALASAMGRDFLDIL